MPAKTTSELPKSVKDNLPKHAQQIYMKAYNSALKQYKDPDKRRGNSSQKATASKVAWSAVKKEYKKNKDGEWVKKD